MSRALWCTSIRIDRTHVSLPDSASSELSANGLSRDAWLLLTKREPVIGLRVLRRVLVTSTWCAAIGAFAGGVIAGIARALGAGDRILLVAIIGAAIGIGAGVIRERVRLGDDETLLSLWVKSDFSYVASAVFDSLGARLRKRARWNVLPTEKIALSDDAIAKGHERFDRVGLMRRWWLGEDGRVWACVGALQLEIDFETRWADKTIEHKLLRIARLARMRLYAKKLVRSPFR